MGSPDTVRIPARRARLFFDREKSEAEQLAATLAPCVNEPAEVIVVIGGDGTMLRAIRKHWRERLPFYGINTGGLGFLLSGRDVTTFWRESESGPPRRYYQLTDAGRAALAVFTEEWARFRDGVDGLLDQEGAR